MILKRYMELILFINVPKIAYFNISYWFCC